MKRPHHDRKTNAPQNAASPQPVVIGTTELISILQGDNARLVLDALQRFVKIVQSQRKIALQIVDVNNDDAVIDDDDDDTLLDHDNDGVNTSASSSNKKAKKDESWKDDTAAYNVPFVGTSTARGTTGRIVVGQWPTGLLQAYLEKSPLASEFGEALVPPNGRFHQQLVKQKNQKLSQLLYKVFVKALAEIVTAGMPIDRVKQLLYQRQCSEFSKLKMIDFGPATPPFVKVILRQHLRHVCNAIQHETALSKRDKQQSKHVNFGPSVPVFLQFLLRLVHVSSLSSFQVVRTFGNSGSWQLLVNTNTSRQNAAANKNNRSNGLSKDSDSQFRQQARSLSFQLLQFWLVGYKDNTVLEILSTPRTKDRAPGALSVALDLGLSPDRESATLLHAISQCMSPESAWRNIFRKESVQNIVQLALQSAQPLDGTNLTFMQFLQEFESGSEQFLSKDDATLSGNRARVLLVKLLVYKEKSPILAAFYKRPQAVQELIGRTLCALLLDKRSSNTYEVVNYCLNKHPLLFPVMSQHVFVPDTKHAFEFLFVTNRLLKVCLSGPGPETCCDFTDNGRLLLTAEHLLWDVVPKHMNRLALNKALSCPSLLVVIETLKYLTAVTSRFGKLVDVCQRFQVNNQIVERFSEQRIANLPDTSYLLKLVSRFQKTDSSLYLNLLYKLFLKLFSTAPEYFADVKYDWTKLMHDDTAIFCRTPIANQMTLLRLLGTITGNKESMTVSHLVSLFQSLVKILIQSKVECVYATSRELALDIYCDLLTNGFDKNSGTYRCIRSEGSYWIDGLTAEHVDTFFGYLQRSVREPMHSSIALAYISLQFDKTVPATPPTVSSILTLCLENFCELEIDFSKLVAQVVSIVIASQIRNLDFIRIVDQSCRLRLNSKSSKSVQLLAECVSALSRNQSETIGDKTKVPVQTALQKLFIGLFSYNSFLNIACKDDGTSNNSSRIHQSCFIDDDYEFLGQTLYNLRDDNETCADNAISTFIAAKTGSITSLDASCLTPKHFSKAEQILSIFVLRFLHKESKFQLMGGFDTSDTAATSASLSSATDQGQLAIAGFSENTNRRSRMFENPTPVDCVGLLDLSSASSTSFYYFSYTLVPPAWRWRMTVSCLKRKNNTPIDSTVARRFLTDVISYFSCHEIDAPCITSDDSSVMLDYWMSMSSSSASREMDEELLKLLSVLEKFMATQGRTSNTASLGFLSKLYNGTGQIIVEQCLKTLDAMSRHGKIDATDWLSVVVSFDAVRYIPFVLDRIKLADEQQKMRYTTAFATTACDYLNTASSIGLSTCNVVDELLELGQDIINNHGTDFSTPPNVIRFITSCVKVSQCKSVTSGLISTELIANLSSLLRQNLLNEQVSAIPVVYLEYLSTLCDHKNAENTALSLIVMASLARQAELYLEHLCRCLSENSMKDQQETDLFLVLEKLMDVARSRCSSEHSDEMQSVCIFLENFVQVSLRYGIERADGSNELPLLCVRAVRVIVECASLVGTTANILLSPTFLLSGLIFQQIIQHIKTVKNGVKPCNNEVKDELFRCSYDCLQQLNEGIIIFEDWQVLKSAYDGNSTVVNSWLERSLQCCQKQLERYFASSYMDEIFILRRTNDVQSDDVPWSWLVSCLERRQVSSALYDIVNREPFSSSVAIAQKSSNDDVYGQFSFSLILSAILGAFEWTHFNLQIEPSTDNHDTTETGNGSVTGTFIEHEVRSGAQNYHSVIETFQKLIDKGSYDIALSALASPDAKLRLLGLSVISLANTITCSKEARLDRWWHSRSQEAMLMTSLKRGITLLLPHALKDGKGISVPRFSMFSAAFLAHAYRILRDPQDPRYVFINKYFLKHLKINGAFVDCFKLPAFRLLFCSTNEDYVSAQTERIWILEIISSCMLGSECYQILQSLHAPEILMSFFDSSGEKKLTESTLILDIFSQILVHVDDKSVQTLLLNVGLFSWISTVMASGQIFLNDQLCTKFWKMAGYAVDRSSNIVPKECFPVICCDICWYVSAYCNDKLKSSEASAERYTGTATLPDSCIAAIDCLSSLRSAVSSDNGITLRTRNHGLTLDFLSMFTQAALHLPCAVDVLLAFCYLPLSSQSLDSRERANQAFEDWVTLSSGSISSVPEHVPALLRTTYILSKEVVHTSRSALTKILSWHKYCSRGVATRDAWFQCIQNCTKTCDDTEGLPLI